MRFQCIDMYLPNYHKAAAAASCLFMQSAKRDMYVALIRELLVNNFRMNGIDSALIKGVQSEVVF